MSIHLSSIRATCRVGTPRETGPKGAMIATVSDGEVVSVEHHALDTVRWASVEVDANQTARAVIEEQYRRSPDASNGAHSELYNSMRRTLGRYRNESVV